MGGKIMSRRIFLRTLLAIVVAVFGLVFLSGNLYAQGNSEEAFERVVAVQEKYTGALMAREGVEGTAVGYDGNGQLVIKVYTANAGVPGVPQRLEGVPVQITVSGKFVARDYTDRYNRPTPIGVSTGHPDITAGTIGCRVIDGSDYIYALSNNHVYANSNDASIGDSALQPGPYDGGQDTDLYRIGWLYDYEPILFGGSANTIDAAIAEVIWDGSTPRVGTDTIDYGTPSSTTVWDLVASRDDILNLGVEKSGRTTQWTTGTVGAVNASVDVCYEARGPFRCVKLARFVDQIIITPGSFSAGGDSGSLIVTYNQETDEYNPVGLLLAGSDEYTIANPIDLVLARFNVTVDDGSGGSTPSDSPPSVSITNPTDGATVSDTVTVTAAASDDNGVTKVEFFVDGGSIGVDTDDSDGWSANWHTINYVEGSHTVSATATDTASQTASDSISATVDNEPSAGVTVDRITPNSMSAGSTVDDVTISGSGFATGGDVTFENGSGPAPEASNVVVVDAVTITATVTAKSGGPPRNRVWDVRVTNPDGSTGVLAGGFTVTP
jgi:hypothetical protein